MQDNNFIDSIIIRDGEKLKREIFIFDICFYLLMFTILDGLYTVLLGLQIQYWSHILFNLFYSVVFASITHFFRSRKTYKGNVTLISLSFFTILLYTAEAIHFESVKTFALWEDIIRMKELTGVMDEVWKMIPIEFLFFLSPLVLAIGYTIIITKKDMHYFNYQTKWTWQKHLLCWLALIVGVVGTNVVIVYGIQDYNKKTIHNSKSYIQKYGVFDAVIFNTFNYFILNRFTADFSESDMKEARRTFENTTLENEMTAKYKGKNLVFITGESVAPYGITEEFTPTLYKMQEEAYNFSNYYAVRSNTFNSEFATLTSFYLTPDKEKQDFMTISSQSMPGLFSEQGYQTSAFHNYKGEFYNRDEKFLELGFDRFLDATALGIHIENEIFAHSDELLFKNSFEYIPASQPFFHYYLTVTSHGYYRSIDRYANTVPTVKEKIMQVKEMYPDLDDNVQTYLASVGVTDDGVAALLDNLEAAGKIDDTVIVFVGDHYPYMMGDDIITSVFGVDNLELYKVPYFIWDATLPQTTIDTYTSNVDILPTISNLFDLPLKYAMGYDVFSTQANKIILEWYDYRGFSFFTQEGGYDANTDKFYGGYTKKEIEYYMEVMLHRAYLNNMQFVLNRV